MRICYLLQGRDNPELALEYAQALSKQAVVVLTLNDEKWRNDAYYILVKNQNILLSTSTPFAQEGDLSSARCWLYQMKDALEKFDFDLCINLTENVLPLTTHHEFIEMLEKSMIKNALSFENDSATDPEFAATMKRYFFSTNSRKFAISEKVRKRARRTANLAYAFGFRRKFEDVVFEGEPWFIFDRNTAINFSEHLSYCTEAFLLGWYPERVIFQTMWKKYLNHKEIDNVCFVEPGKKTEKAFFKRYDKLTDRKVMAEILHTFEPSYVAPYDFVAEEIVEADNRSYLQKTLDGYKKKK
jgi:hypothetical protein